MSDELDAPIEVGDVVALVCGGPGMAVTRIVKSDAYCAWFDEDSQLLEAIFPKVCLRITDGILREEDDE